TLWLPGADHAGFETQVVYEKKLEKEGRSRFGMDPEALRKEIFDFTIANKEFMEGQLRELGASCDWSREKFTLDSDVIKTVYGTFKKLYDDGLIYRGKRTVNWCPKHQTSLSELETESAEEQTPFYYFKYGPFTIGTVRPETKFGDKYVVMHPDDARYAEFKEGQTLEVEWINGPLTATIIKDEAVDPSFGSGVMTITPWHSQVDFEIAKRHGLDYEQIIDWRAKLLRIGGEFAGMKITEARLKIAEKLKEKGLLVKVDENYKNVVKRCYKCNSAIEPQVKDQWFLSMTPLAKPLVERIERDEVIFYPENYKKVLLHWLTNIEDWNISRQIVWGIPIPVWYHEPKCIPKPGQEDDIAKCIDTIVSIDKPACEFCDGEFVRDTDTFDTWFSSGQWPFATLGFPDGEDFRKFYPTQVMETAGEIIFFWVARMLMLGLYRTGTLPFNTVYLHGIVTARDGKKMSKSRGNVISPLELTKKYGTDALRMALIIGNTPGTSTALYEEKIKAYKLFANKLWNIARFVLSTIDGVELDRSTQLNGKDRATLLELSGIAKEITENIEQYRFYIAGEKIYHYVWNTFADKILEESKLRLAGDDAADKRSAQLMLFLLLEQSLILLHPFMPFITEEIWGSLPDRKWPLIVTPYVS
ncbi:MAG TPA: valine--tRNA ligase, partial [Candidatus Peribacteraceae bacterium]|nr:valine--tRNA ligase [Candidatus Peribacteraceae bacterium]